MTARDPAASRAGDASAVAFRHIPRRRLLEGRLFRGSIPGLRGPLSTLRLLLSKATAWLGAGADRYSFTVWLFHPLHLAGL